MISARRRGKVITYFAYLVIGIIFLACSFLKKEPVVEYSILVLIIWIAGLVYFSLSMVIKFLPNAAFELGFCIWGCGLGVALMLFWEKSYVLFLIFIIQWAIVANYLKKWVIHLLVATQVLAFTISLLIPKLDYVINTYSTFSILIFLAALIVADLTACQTVNNFNMMYEEVKEHDRSLDDLLKIVEAKHDEARAATKTKSEFLSNMSHEIRTPINAILGMNEMILRETNEDSVKEYSSDIKNSGNLLLSLVNDILDISKIEDGKMELVPVEFSLQNVIDDVGKMIQSKMDDKGLKFNVMVDDRLPSKYIGDEIRIKQILINLLSNAAKYTNTGRVDLTVLDNHLSYCQSLRFSVEDTGIGIKPEDIAKINEKFVRFDEEKNRYIEGSGLGITIVNGFLKMMGSTLRVESVYGVGSIFYFDLTLEVADSTPIKDTVMEVKEETKYTSAFEAPDSHVLVVDDNSMNIKVFVGLLKATRIQIDTALSGEEAVFLGEYTKYDAVFMDHMMPGMDGIETMKAMTTDSSLNKDTPFIALTANAVSGAKQMYLKNGFTDMLTKPVSPEELEETVKRYCK